MKTLYTKFHAKHPNITVQFQNVPAEQSGQKLTSEVAGAIRPTSPTSTPGAVNQFATRKTLLNLDDYLSHSTGVRADDFVPAFKQFTTYDNIMYGLPFDGESSGLFYRTDLFKAAGIKSPPKTWAQFDGDGNRCVFKTTRPT